MALSGGPKSARKSVMTMPLGVQSHPGLIYTEIVGAQRRISACASFKSNPGLLMQRVVQLNRDRSRRLQTAVLSSRVVTCEQRNNIPTSADKQREGRTAVRPLSKKPANKVLGFLNDPTTRGGVSHRCATAALLRGQEVRRRADSFLVPSG